MNPADCAQLITRSVDPTKPHSKMLLTSLERKYGKTRDLDKAIAETVLEAGGNQHGVHCSNSAMSKIVTSLGRQTTFMPYESNTFKMMLDLAKLYGKSVMKTFLPPLEHIIEDAVKNSSNSRTKKKINNLTINGK